MKKRILPCLIVGILYITLGVILDDILHIESPRVYAFIFYILGAVAVGIFHVLGE
jgi:hypothetical protein